MESELEIYLDTKLKEQREEVRNKIEKLSSASKLLEKRRQLVFSNDELDVKREHFKKKMDNVENKKMELDMKEKKLKESLKKFDKFVKENDSKKFKAFEMAASDKELRQMKEKDIEMLKREKEVLLLKKSEILKSLNRSAIYQAFLKKVVSASDEYQETRDILLREMNMRTTKKKLMENAHKNQDTLAQLKNSLLAYKEEKHNEVLNFNNDLLNLKSEYEKVHDDLLAKRSRWNKIYSSASDKMLKFGQVILAVHNLHEIVRQHRNKFPVGEEDGEEALELTNIEKKIDKVIEYTEDLSAITADENCRK